MTQLMFDRRLFLGSSLAGGALLATGCSPAAEDSAAEPTGITARPYEGKLGVQLYTVRDLFEADYLATLQAIASIGFKDLEFAGYFAHNPADVKAAMDDLGLISQSSHVQVDDVRDNFSQVLDIAGTMGQKNLILPWLPEDQRTADVYREIADLMNTRGEEAAAAGMRLGYHNHEFEFDDLGDGVTGYDILLDRTDPAHTFFELDFHWTAVAGVNPLDLFPRAPGRFITCHLKDRDAAGEMVSVGDGVIDFQSSLAMAEEIGMEGFYVEHDNPEDPIASISRSYAYLTS